VIEKSISVTEAARIVPVPTRAKTGRELGRLWPSLPHLSIEAPEAFEADLKAARVRLPRSGRNKTGTKPEHKSGLKFCSGK